MGGEEPTPIELKLDEKYDKTIELYDNVLMRNKTVYDKSILRSFRWFQKGKLESNPHEKFLAFWIAIEQLILTNTKYKALIVKRTLPGHKKRLLRYMPHLSITWRNSEAYHAINEFLEKIVPMITARSAAGRYLHGDPEKRRWKENYGILLENLPQLKNMARKKQLKETLELLQNYISQHRRSMVKEYKQNLECQKFKVARLYEKRNMIVHEGFINDDELALMTKALEILLPGVIDPILELKEDRTIKQIIKEINRPYTPYSN